MSRLAEFEAAEAAKRRQARMRTGMAAAAAVVALAILFLFLLRDGEPVATVLHVVVVDASGSTQEADYETRKRTAQRLVAGSAGAHVFVDLMHDDRIRTVYDASTDCEGLQQLDCEDALAQRRARLADTLQEALAVRPEGGSDYVAALQLVEHHAASVDADTVRVTFIGDGLVHSVGAGDMAQRGEWGDDAIEALLAAVEPDGPEHCRGWEIRFVGAASGGAMGVHHRTAQGVKAFWERYIAECQGRFVGWDQVLAAD